MTRSTVITALTLLLFAGCGARHVAPPAEAGPQTAVNRPALVIHGGAGTITRDSMTPEVEEQYRTILALALETGFAVLEDGGSSVDAVEATLRLMEDSPLFNAGKGAVFTAGGRNELDASIMDGSTLEAGAVAAITTIRNPISAARAVMEQSPHVLLAGPGAEAFAAAVGQETVDPDYFFTERRWQQWEKRRQMEAEAAQEIGSTDKHGTVGAVALDLEGRIAAGTTTGGMTYKQHGRIGDSPIIGAGTYADDSCGVSATGHGEFFIRFAVAHDICARSRYRGISVTEAAKEVVMRVLVEAGGSGGIVALDAAGVPTMVFNSEGMYRGWITSHGEPQVAIYRTEND